MERIGMRSYIEFENVKKIYQMGEVQIKALDGVDFTIEKGEFVVIAGESGAGKSTILNLLGGMDQVSEGSIFVDGNEISAYSSKELTMYRRYDIGFVFQFYNLVQNLNVKENVELATQICKNPLNVDEVIEAVGLKERKANFPAQLSGVTKQEPNIEALCAPSSHSVCPIESLPHGTPTQPSVCVHSNIAQRAAAKSAPRGGNLFVTVPLTHSPNNTKTSPPVSD